jgi:hypothetical protein
VPQIDIDAALSADSSLSGSVTAEFVAVAAFVGNSGISCPGFNKVRQINPSPNPPARVIPSGVRVVPPSPNMPSYGIQSSGGATANRSIAVQTQIKQPTVTRKRQPS